MAVGELWTGRRQQGTGTGGQAQLGRAGTGGWLGSLFWADGLSIETQPHPWSPPLPSSEQSQLSTSSTSLIWGEKENRLCYNMGVQMCQLWYAECWGTYLETRHEGCYQRDFQDTSLSCIQKIVPTHRGFCFSKPWIFIIIFINCHTFWPPLNLQHVVSKVQKLISLQQKPVQTEAWSSSCNSPPLIIWMSFILVFELTLERV